MQDLKNFSKAEAERLGFCLCGFTGAAAPTDFERYLLWLEKGPLGTMGYLKRPDTVAKRADPHLLLPGAQSICVLGIQMGLQKAGIPEVASYAHYVDYHDAILPMAEALIQRMQACLQEHQEYSAYTNLNYRICIDSSPILERSLAVQAGLGWIGKSSMLVNPTYGSALFLCEILLSLPIEPDKPYTGDGCGSCMRCINACPNHCIDPETRTIRADHCASYLTIEHKGEFTPEQSELAGTHLFGCDACLRACPWNSKNTGKSPLPPAPVLPDMQDYAISDEDFKIKYKNTAVLRTKARGLRRNIEAVRRNLSDKPGNNSETEIV